MKKNTSTSVSGKGIILFAAFLVSLYGPAEASLIAHYEFEGNVNNSSGWFPNGTVNGSVAYSSGMVGQAIELDGPSNVLFNGTFYPVGTGALSMYVYLDSSTFDYTDGMAWITSSPKNNFKTNFSYFIERDTLHIGHTIQDLQLDQWMMLTLVYQNGTSSTNGFEEAYINGQLVGTHAGYINNHAGLSGDGIRIGTNMVGLIDDFRVYDHALSAGEVLALYNEHPVPIPGAVWLFGSALLCISCIRRRIQK